MKQHITTKQWDEISDKQQEKFFEDRQGINNFDKEVVFYDYPDIGQMIEFLGEGLNHIRTINKLSKGYEVWVSGQGIWFYTELVDALWEAVKQKLDKN